MFVTVIISVEMIIILFGPSKRVCDKADNIATWKLRQHPVVVVVIVVFTCLAVAKTLTKKSEISLYNDLVIQLFTQTRWSV